MTLSNTRQEFPLDANELATAGGFELMRINPFGKKLEIIPSPKNGYGVDYLKAIVHHSKVYVRPIPGI